MYVTIWHFVSFYWQNTNVGGCGRFNGEIVLKISPQGTIPTINNTFDILFCISKSLNHYTLHTLLEFGIRNTRTLNIKPKGMQRDLIQQLIICTASKLKTMYSILSLELSWLPIIYLKIRTQDTEYSHFVHACIENGETPDETSNLRLLIICDNVTCLCRFKFNSKHKSAFTWITYLFRYIPGLQLTSHISHPTDCIQFKT